MIKTVYDMYTDKFEWKRDPYEYVFDINPFDVVCGTDKIRKQIERGITLSEIEDSWGSGLQNFIEIRQPFLLY